MSDEINIESKFSEVLPDGYNDVSGQKTATSDIISNPNEQSTAEACTCQVEPKPTLSKKENVLQAVKFGLFSMSAGAIQTISFTLLNELTHLPYWPSYLIALILSVVYNFTVNRKFTFKSAANIPIAMLKVFGYYCVFTPLSTWWGHLLADEMGINRYIVLFGTMIINLITEFTFYRFVVFRNSINSSVGEKDE